jgi:hypothetical protein
MHSFGEVPARGFERQMKMIPHYDEGVQAPCGQAAGFEKAFLEGARGAFVLEEILAIISAAEDVIDGAWELDSGKAAHGEWDGTKRVVEI